jgi:hypothetical protein
VHRITVLRSRRRVAVDGAWSAESEYATMSVSLALPPPDTVIEGQLSAFYDKQDFRDNQTSQRGNLRWIERIRSLGRGAGRARFEVLGHQRWCRSARLAE